MGCLKNLIISATPDIGYKPEQLKKWIEANSGVWMSKIGRETKTRATHLICSKAAWKKGDECVQIAQAMGAFIVSYDWLEDSLQAKRKLAENKYTWARISAEKKKSRERKKVAKAYDTKKFHKGAQKAIEDIGSGESSSRSGPGLSPTKSGGSFVSSLDALKQARKKREVAKKGKAKATPAVTTAAGNLPNPSSPVSSLVAAGSSLDDAGTPSAAAAPPAGTSVVVGSTTENQEANPPRLKDNHHTYLDATGFEYDLTLVRTNLLLNSFATYRLRLYESNTMPHTYCTYIQYAPPKEAQKAVVQKNGVPILAPFDTNAAETNSNSNTRTDIDAPPPANKPFRTLLAPLNSDFEPAFKVFRHAFRDCTLLSWEERLSPNAKPLQIERAKAMKIEPYICRPPGRGLTQGMAPSLSFNDKEYVRGSLLLPGISTELSPGGSIGNLLQREAEALKKLKEEEEEKKRVEDLNKRTGMKLKAGTRPNWNQPLFNSVAGPGLVGNAGGYRGAGPTGSGIRKSKPFPHSLVDRYL